MDKKSLVKIAQESAELERILIESDGQLTPEIEAALEVKEIELPDKVEAYHHIINRVEMLTEHYKKQADFYLRLKKTCENFQQALEENIKTTMRITGKPEINGNTVVYKLVNSNPKLIIENQDAIPAEYKTQVVETVVNNKMIKEHLVAGLEVEGAKLEPTVSLRKYGRKI